jgi:hypothetical protein
MNVLLVLFIIVTLGIVALGTIAIYLSLLVDKLHNEIDSLQPPF